MASDALKTYREMQAELDRIRESHADQDSPEEDDLLDKMDAVWLELTPEEQTTINTEKGINSNGCPWPHYIEVLYGVPVMAIEDMPKKCLCGADLQYADSVAFVEGDFLHKFDESDGVIVETVEIPPSNVTFADVYGSYLPKGTTPPIGTPVRQGHVFSMNGIPVKITGAPGVVETFDPATFTKPVPGVVKVAPTMEVIRNAVGETKALNPPPTELTEVEQALVNRLLGRWTEIQKRWDDEIAQKIIEPLSGKTPANLSKDLLAAMLKPIAMPSMIREDGPDGTSAILGCNIGTILILRPDGGLVIIDGGTGVVYYTRNPENK